MQRRIAAVVVGMSILALVCAAPAGAWYATGGVGHEGGEVYVYGEAGEQHDVTAVGVPGPGGVDPFCPGCEPYAGSVVIHDSKAPVTPPPSGLGNGCTVIDDHTEHCHGFNADWTTGGVRDGGVLFLTPHYETGRISTIKIPASSAPMYLQAYTGPGNDSVETDDLFAANAELGDGNDRIVVHGSEGGGELGLDGVEGGAGNDTFDLVNGRNDSVLCGDGNDTLRGDPSDASPDCENQQLVNVPQPPP